MAHSSPPPRQNRDLDLRGRYSPEQIVGRLRRQFPDDPEMRVSPETIYQSLYVGSEWSIHVYSPDRQSRLLGYGVAATRLDALERAGLTGEDAGDVLGRIDTRRDLEPDLWQTKPHTPEPFPDSRIAYLSPEDSLRRTGPPTA